MLWIVTSANNSLRQLYDTGANISGSGSGGGGGWGGGATATVQTLDAFHDEIHR